MQVLVEQVLVLPRALPIMIQVIQEYKKNKIFFQFPYPLNNLDL